MTWYLLLLKDATKIEESARIDSIKQIQNWWKVLILITHTQSYKSLLPLNRLNAKVTRLTSEWMKPIRKSIKRHVCIDVCYLIFNRKTQSKKSYLKAQSLCNVTPSHCVPMPLNQKWFFIFRIKEIWFNDIKYYILYII